MTTLTQNLVFTFQSFVDQYPSLNIVIQEAADEETNGNDLELVLEFPNEGRAFYAVLQAKKIDRNGKYYKLDHGRQIENLIAYASRQNAIPLYLLYNTVRNGYWNPIPQEFGCSLISAQFLKDNFYQKRNYKHKDGSITKKWIYPHFNDLHNGFGFPWDELVCGVKNEADLQNKLSKYQSESPSNALVLRQGFVDLDSVPKFLERSRPRKFESDLPMEEEPRAFRLFEESEGPSQPISDDFSPQHRITLNVQPS